MQRYEYTFIRLEGPTEDETAEYAQTALNTAQDEDYQYVSGPEIQRYPGGTTIYVLLVRKPIQSKHDDPVPTLEDFREKAANQE